MSDKVKVEIPMGVLDDMVTKFGMTIDEAIRASVEGTIKVITDDLKQQYEVYKSLKE